MGRETHGCTMSPWDTTRGSWRAAAPAFALAGAWFASDAHTADRGAAEGDADAHMLSGQLDLRYVASDATDSFLRGGFGLTRFDEQHKGAQLGRAFLEYRGRLLDTVNARVTLDAYGDGDKNPLDVSEAFLEWRPWPRNSWRWRIRAGAFYPPVSLENRAHGWNSEYSLSSSAINTWLGEEIRTIGAEANATWMGARLGHAVDVSLIGGVYGWNDPAGVLIFQRGWALHDRQTALFGGLPSLFPTGTSRHQLELFHEIDDRPGYYAGAQMVHPGRGLTLRALHYDNRGDPGISNGYEYAWRTRFDGVGLQLDLPADWTIIGQWMTGDTSVGPSADGRGLLIADFDAYFGLLSRRIGKHRLTLRYDDFYTDMTRGAQLFPGYQDGDAVTVCYSYAHDRHWRLLAEASRIDSKAEQRKLVGLEEHAVEKTLQIAVRYAF